MTKTKRKRDALKGKSYRERRVLNDTYKHKIAG